MSSLSLILAATALLAPNNAIATATYDLVKEYSGSSFFDGWDFYGHCAYPAPEKTSNIELTTTFSR
jgi:hypothetical protein